MGVLIGPLVALAFLFAGVLGGSLAWSLGLWLLGVPVLLRTGIGLARGRWAADIVAACAILAAMALDHPFAGLIIVLMQTGGEALERFAERRASAAVRELEDEVPSIAHRVEGAQIQDVPAAALHVGDRILVRPGEMVPADGTVETGSSRVDVSRITGEPVPLLAEAGTRLHSGALVQEGALVVRVAATASRSLYARIVELVRTAQAGKAPLQRLADRYAIWFTPLVLLVALAAWLISGNPDRGLAVLVVATPCPLLLATPVAIVGGINRAARRRVIIRHGGALEALAAVDTVVFDKTGTLTIGHPEVSAVLALPPFEIDTVLGLAGAVEQHSGHLLARTLVRAALARGLSLQPPELIVEFPGRGVTGVVEGKRVVVGAYSLVAEQSPDSAAALATLRSGEAVLQAYVSVDGAPAGAIRYADQIRSNAGTVVAGLRDLGVTRILLLTGDHTANARAVGAAVGIDDVEADLLPQDKAVRVGRLAQEGRHVLMVGDGTNDAPALATSAVGLALGAHGGGIVTEAADVVLLADDLARIPEALLIGRETLRVARQSIVVGLGLSAAGMLYASAGGLPPTAGALVQEGIDVAVILHALRAAHEGPLTTVSRWLHGVAGRLRHVPRQEALP